MAALMQAIATVGTFLLAHRDVIGEVYDALENGTPKEALKKAIREAKKQASQAAIFEELEGK